MRTTESRVALGLALATLAPALATACGARRAAGPGAVATPVAVAGLEGQVSALVEAALVADARFAPEADSLYAPYATVITGGEEQLTYPRYAGVDSGGFVAITASQVEVRPGIAWADVDYRWVAPERNEARPARATFVLTPRNDGSGWWIVHAHSSAPPPAAGDAQSPE